MNQIKNYAKFTRQKNVEHIYEPPPGLHSKKEKSGKSLSFSNLNLTEQISFISRTYFSFDRIMTSYNSFNCNNITKVNKNTLTNFVSWLQNPISILEV